jgi:hypothetical protein
MSGALPLASVVDWGQILQVVEAGLVAGVGISVAFSLLLLGTVRAGEAQQQSRTGAVIGYSLVAVLAVAICVGAIAFAVITMLAK